MFSVYEILHFGKIFVIIYINLHKSVLQKSALRFPSNKNKTVT